MFRIVANPTFPVVVKIHAPGQPQPLELRLVCRHKTMPAYKAWLESARTADDEARFVGEIVADWSDVVDAEGRPVPFGQAALGQLLAEHVTAGRDIVNAYGDELLGARAKN
jgi:hypothetical protein